jgi:LPXTG-site transpeptidase (sortase) family protein
MRYLKRLMVFLVLFLAIFLALNWGYFSTQIGYYLNPPQVVEPPPNPDPEHKVEPNKLWIRSLGVEAPVVYSEADTEAEFQVALRDGVAHFTGTAMPGDFGNVYIMGHSSDFPTAPGNYKTVFALLPKISPGDNIELSGPDGKLYNYKVESEFVADPDDIHLVDQDLSKKQLTLQTSYPIGTALKRYIVVAYLQE